MLMGLENFTLGKISHIQKSKYYIVFSLHIWYLNLKKKDLKVEGVLLRQRKGVTGRERDGKREIGMRRMKIYDIHA